MLCSFPYEWRQYMIKGKTLTFGLNTPENIIKEAQKINAASLEHEGKFYFHFEGEKN